MFHLLDMQASSLKLSCTFRWRLGPDWVLAIKMYGKTEILSAQISETKHAIQFKISLSFFLMSTKSYLKFMTIRGIPQKWVGFGKPLLPPINHCHCEPTINSLPFGMIALSLGVQHVIQPLVPIGRYQRVGRLCM